MCFFTTLYLLDLNGHQVQTHLEGEELLNIKKMMNNVFTSINSHPLVEVPGCQHCKHCRNPLPHVCCSYVF